MMGLHLPGAAFVNPGTAAARCADHGGGAAAGRDRPAQAGLHAARASHRRAGDRERHGRAARDRRLDQPHAASGGHRPRRRPRDRLGRLRRPLGRDPAAGARLSERGGRREPLPRRRRHGLHRAPAAGRRPRARAGLDRRRAGPAPLPAGAVPRRDRAGLARGPGRLARPLHPAAGGRAVRQPRRDRASEGRPWPRDDQDLGGEARTPYGRGPGQGVRRPGRAAGRLPGRPAHRRLRRRRPLPGPEGQRHAGAAQPHAHAGRPARPRPEGGAGHRRADVRRLRQGSGRPARDARGDRAGAARLSARRRRDPPRRRGRRARGQGRSGGAAQPHAGDGAARRATASAASSSATCATPSAPPRPAPRSCSERARWRRG